jgi:topoisomerase-4 subunit B
MSNKSYTAEAIEVLSGLDPVRKRPGMYTDTSRPNHLAQEAIDNSADEAIAGFATEIKVILYKDGSLEVIDNGRGMPVDIHPEEKISGVELIMTRLHAGAKFSHKNYKFSGGLHGVGISVVNALSSTVIVTVRRDSHIYQMEFKDGEPQGKLKIIGTTNKRDSGTGIHFNPNPKYFETPKFSVPKLQHLLRAKAVLCAGLNVIFYNEATNETQTWCYINGLQDYLQSHFLTTDTLPSEPFIGSFTAETETADWAVLWQTDQGEMITESYVNLIPTIQGGTHVNGLRAGLLEAMREFCEIQNLLPRGIKLTPEDVWQNCNYVLSVKLQEPEFAGQTKERLTSRQCAAFVTGVVKDAFSLWLNQHVEQGKALAELIIQIAQKRMRASKAVERKRITQGPALPGKLADCSSEDLKQTELFLVEGDSAGGSAKQARDREFQAIMPLRGKILNTWEVDSTQVLNSQEVHDIAVAIGIDPGAQNIDELRYGKICILTDADHDGSHIATLLCALFIKHFRVLVEKGIVFVAMPPLFRIDAGKEIYYALDEDEKNGILDRLQAEHKKSKVSITRFKGLGEMNPLQLRETTMSPTTRRLVQLTVDDLTTTNQFMDMILAKKRASDRRQWLEEKGDLAEI